MINNAMIMIPARFANKPPVNPDANRMGVASGSWTRASGLAADIEYYGSILKKSAFERIGKNYPKVKLPASLGGGSSTAVAWIWARTVTCSNPACGKRSPLVKSFIVSGKQHIGVGLKFEHDGEITYEVTKSSIFNGGKGTVDRSGAKCVYCGSPISFAHIREEGKRHNLGSDLMAVVYEGRGGKTYISPDSEQKLAADIKRISAIDGDLAFYPGYVNPVAYGLTTIEDLFSNRQLLAIDTFTELVSIIQKEAESDATAAGMPNDHIALVDGGRGAQAYGEAIAVYLAFVVDKLADRCSTICGWDSTRDGMRNTFGLTGMPMSWDYAEVNRYCKDP